MLDSVRALWTFLQADRGVRRLIEAGKYEDAIVAARAALTRYEAACDPHDPYLLTPLDRLIGLYTTTGNFAEAQVLQARRRVIFDWITDENNPEVHGISALLRRINRFFASGRATPLGVLYRPAVRAERWLALIDRIGNRLGLEVARAYDPRERVMRFQAALYTDPAVLAAQEVMHRQLVAACNKAPEEAAPLLAGSLYLLALVCARTKRSDEALQLLQDASAVDDRLVQALVRGGSEAQQLAHLQCVRMGVDLYLTLVYERFSNSSAGVQSALDVVLRRKGLAAEVLGAQRDVALSGMYPALAQQLEELRALRRQMAASVVNGQELRGADAAARSIRALTDQKERLEEELARKIPELELEHRLATADHVAVRKALSTGDVLVEFVRFTPFNLSQTASQNPKGPWRASRYLAFVVGGGESQAIRMFDLGRADEIDALVTRFRAAITGDETGRTIRGLGSLGATTDDITDRSGHRLRTCIFDPLRTAVPPSARLFIAPDGELSRVPFEALPNMRGGRLLDDHTVSYLNSGRDLLRFGRTHGRSAQSIVIADPDFDLTAIPEETTRSSEASPTEVTPRSASTALRAAIDQFDPLPATREEALQVAGLLGAEVWVGAGALEARVKRVVSPRVLHLATHGFFLGGDRPPASTALSEDDQTRVAQPGGLARLREASVKNPLLGSGLALAGANTWLRGAPLPADAEDGILTAQDVSGLNLTGTELVVLSACETGLGQIRTGEGVFGLQRAFLLAGAKTLVMSLWNVPDAETRELMVAFYQRLSAGMPPAEALHAAKQALRQRVSAPRYWAGFICLGESASMTATGIVDAVGQTERVAVSDGTPPAAERAVPTSHHAHQLTVREGIDDGSANAAFAPVLRSVFAGVGIVLICVLAPVMADAFLPPFHAALFTLMRTIDTIYASIPLIGEHLISTNSSDRSYDVAIYGVSIAALIVWSRRLAIKISGCGCIGLIVIVLAMISAIPEIKTEFNAINHGQYRCDPICHVLKTSK